MTDDPRLQDRRQMKNRVLVASIALALMSLPAAAQERASYQLQRGDSVKLSIFGQPSLNTEAPINIDGQITLPLVGHIDAVGKTIADLTEIVSSGLVGQVHRYVNSDGAEIVHSIRKEDVQISIASYRPIAVYGAVASPGEIAFRAGMTVRAALAVTGFGGQVVVSSEGATALRGAELTGKFDALEERREHLQAQSWRLAAELRRIGGAEPIEPAADATVPADVDDEQLAQLQLRLDARERKIIHIKHSIERIEEQIRILREREVAEASALEADNEDKARVDRLLARGIVNNDRALDMRRAQLSSATRLLQTQEAIARSVQRHFDLQHELEAEDTLRSIELREELAAARLEASLIGAEIAAVRGQLAALGIFVSSDDEQLSLTLHRMESGKMVSIEAQMDDVLSPGDIVEVGWQPAR